MYIYIYIYVYIYIYIPIYIYYVYIYIQTKFVPFHVPKSVANDMAADQFCETTIGYKNAANGELFRMAFDAPALKVTLICLFIHTYIYIYTYIYTYI